MRTIWSRFVSLFRGRRLDRDLNDELQAHLAMQEEEFRAQGMSADEAREAARREFGGITRTAEEYREQRGVPQLETAARDLRYALRGLARNPGFTAAAVLSLALGIGANTAIFSMFHALMLRLLPVSRPEQLVTLYRSGGWGKGYCSYPFYLEVQKRSDLFAGAAAFGSVEKVRFHYGSGDGFETAQRTLVSGNYFHVLGVSPALGRLFTDADNRTPRAEPLAILSYEYWQKRFGADAAVVGRTIVVDNDPLTVIGVAPRGFHGLDLDHRPDLWEPVMMMRGDIMEPGSYWAWIVGRRKPEVPRSTVQAAMSVLLKQHLAGLYGNSPNAAFRKIAMDQRIEVREGANGLSMLRDNFGQALMALLAAVGLALLAACANVANLLLARGAARQKEMAVRLSLGASRWRLMRQALAESLLLAFGGTLLGVALAYWGESGLLWFLPSTAGNPFDVAPSASVLAFTAGVALLSVMLFGLAPAWRASAIDPALCIKTGTGQASAREPALRKALVATQVAFSVMLVALAGLFGHSLAALRSVNLGFRHQNVVMESFEFPDSWKPDQWTAARDRLVGEMRAMPGVSMVSFGSPGPYLGGYSNSSLRVPGSEITAREPAWVNVQRIAPQFFAVLGSRPLEGREFDDHDTARSRKVALVNEAFVREFLPGERHPLTRVLNFDERKYDPTQIVGVVRDIPHQGLRKKVDPTVYLPVTQNEAAFGALLLETDQPAASLAAAIRRTVAKLGPEVTGAEPKTIRRRIDDSIYQDRMLATVGGFFGALALLLAAVGVYGVVAYGTARRAREIGIRVAMGARRTAVLWMVLRGALLLVSAGLAAGLPISLFAARRIAPLLFRVPSDDSFAFVTTACVLLAAGLAAAYVPARRAARLDPMRVLREE